MKEKLKQFGSWSKANADLIAIYGTYIVIGVGITAITIVSAVQQNKRYEEEIAKIEADQKSMRDAVQRGATVLPGPEGSFWIIDPK